MVISAQVRLNIALYADEKADTCEDEPMVLTHGVSLALNLFGGRQFTSLVENVPIIDF